MSPDITATAIVLSRTPTGARVYWLVATNGTYPSILGHLEETPQGYIPTGYRKPIPDLTSAVQKLIGGRMRQALKDAAEFAKMLELPVSNPAIGKPVDERQVIGSAPKSHVDAALGEKDTTP